MPDVTPMWLSSDGRMWRDEQAARAHQQTLNQKIELSCFLRDKLASLLTDHQHQKVCDFLVKHRVYILALLQKFE